MRITNPHQQLRDRRKDHCREEQAKVPRSDACGRAQDNVSDGANETECGDKWASDADVIRKPCNTADDEECKQVWWSAQSLTLDGAETSHLRDDGGGEQRERCEADVGAEVADTREISCRSVSLIDLIERGETYILDPSELEEAGVYSNLYYFYLLVAVAISECRSHAHAA